MPIQLDCPRCKKPLSVPSRKAGTYVNCPQCKGQFWVPDAVDQAAAASATPREDVARAATPAPTSGVAAPPGVGPAPGGKNIAKFVIPLPSDSPVASPTPGPVAADAAPTSGVSPSDRVVSPASSGPVPVAAPPGAARGSGVAWSPVTPPVEPAVLPAGAPRVPEPAVREKAPAVQAGLPAKTAAGAVRPAATSKSPAPAGPPLPAPPPSGALSPSDRRDKLPQAGPKVARFITTEAAQSSLKLAEDGKLPELHLREPGDAAAKEQTSKGANPLVLFGLLALSMVMTLVMVMVPTEPSGGVTTQKREEARQIIEREYFRDMDSPQPRKEYQVALREAQQAHARGDFRRERELYREVLRKLRAERGPFDPGLTGSQQRDRELEKLLETLMATGG